MQLELFEQVRDFRAHRKYREGIFKTKAEIARELRNEGRTRIIRILSFGGGTQSAHLLENHLRGAIDYDAIIFADTGAEPEFIHEQVQWWQQRLEQVGVTTPFIITRHNSMPGGLEEMMMRYIFTDYQRFQMPVYCATVDENGEIKPAGMMPRQCTVDFKIVPVKQMARRMVMQELGLEYQQKFPDDIGIIIDIGFSYDEIKRINTYRSPQFKYMRLAYPLVEENLTTADIIQFLEQNEFPLKRSRCYLCPFNCDGNRDIGMDWDEIIREEPLSFLKACWFDEQLRRVQPTKIMRTIPYLHYSRQPLAEVYQEEYQSILQSHHLELEAWTRQWGAEISDKYMKNVQL